MYKKLFSLLVMGIILSSCLTDYAGSETKVDYATLTQQAVLKGDWDKVIEYGKEWVNMTTENPVGHFVLGSAYCYKTRYNDQSAELHLIEDEVSKEAILIWANEVVRDNPENKYARLLRGFAYYHKGEYQKARRDWEEAVKLDPDGPAGRMAQDKLDLLKKMGY